MKKTRIDLELLLPGIPDEQDMCVNRILDALKKFRGVEAVHIVPATAAEKAQLCFHYNPELITIQQIESQARKEGAAILDRYGHIAMEVKGIRHARHARRIEERLKKLPGLKYCALSPSGYLTLEYDKSLIRDEVIRKAMAAAGLKTDPEKAEGTAAVSNPVKRFITEKTELALSILCGIFLAAGFTLSFFESIPEILIIALYIISYLFGGYYTTKEAIAGISKGKFEIDFLMLVAAIGAAALGEWAEGALLLFLFSMGHALEHYSLDKARKSIKALAALTPDTAILKNGAELKEVPVAALVPGDIIFIKPNSRIAADGLVIQGSGAVNQASITGESIPAEKSAHPDAAGQSHDFSKLEDAHKVFAGSINGNTALEVQVFRKADDSTISRMVRLVNEAQTQKSKTQDFADKIERYYVPAVLIMITLLLFAFLVIDETFADSFYRAMAVLVAASPCALAISTPSAVLSAIARSARGGILIKGGKPLEEMAGVNTVAFDKTGTLTEGKPKLTGVYPLNGLTTEEILPAIIASEKLSDHPLAAAIVKGGSAILQRDIAPAAEISSITGRGLKAIYEQREVYIGNKELFTEKGDTISTELLEKIASLEQQGNTTMVVQDNGHFTGIIALMDIPRSDAKATLQALHNSGIREMVMLTGDNQRVADAIAAQTGLTTAMGNLLPEQKVEAIETLMRRNKRVAMVGDGVNDAPAMARSAVGIAMGAAGSDVALETADVALMADKLINLPFAFSLAKKARQIITQNLIISMGMVAVLIPLTLAGIASMGPAVIGHEGSTLVVVLNALRLLGFKNRFRPAESNTVAAQS